MTTRGIAYATREADEAVALATEAGKGTWRAGIQPAQLSALDSTMRPIDRLDAAGLGALTHLFQRSQGVIDRMTGKAATIRAFAEAWQRAATEMDEARTNFDRTLRTDTSSWAGEAVGAWRNRAAEYLQAMRGSAAAAKATAAVATAMGETVAGARQNAARIVGDVVDAVINMARAYSSTQGSTTELLVRAARMTQGLETQVAGIQSDVVNSIAQFQSSSSGRLQDLWKRLGVWFGALPRGMTAKPAPTDAERGAFGRGGAYLDGAYIHLVPRNPDVPRVRLPNNVGATGFEVGPAWNVLYPEHTYHVSTDTTIPFDRAREFFGEEISRNPVPSNADPDDPTSAEWAGRPEGVTNNAGSAFGSDNLVRTYTYPSPDPSRFTDITVNYTLGDKHILQEGYVIRYGERMPDGTTRIVSYGEGNGLLQHPVSPAHLVFREAWQNNHAEIEASVNHRMNMPPR